MDTAVPHVMLERCEGETVNKYIFLPKIFDQAGSLTLAQILHKQASLASMSGRTCWYEWKK